MNWWLASLRTAVESDTGRTLAERLASLAKAACIVEGLALDSNGWAALLGLKNARSFLKIKRRNKLTAHKPGAALLFSADDLLRASLQRAPHKEHKEMDEAQ